MAKPKWYSPQLSRELVSRLYHLAKSKSLPMTTVANQLLEEALSNKEQINRRTQAKNQQTVKPNQ
jgi:hypothetical protein